MHIITRNIRIRFHQTLFLNKNILDYCKYIGVFLFSNDLLPRKDIQPPPCSKSGSNSVSWKIGNYMKQHSFPPLVSCYVQNRRSYQGQRSFHLCCVLFLQFFLSCDKHNCCMLLQFWRHERYYRLKIIQTFLML